MTIFSEIMVEQGALIITENLLDVLPVTKMSKIVGIIAESNIFKFLARMSGAIFRGNEDRCGDR